MSHVTPEERMSCAEKGFEGLDNNTVQRRAERGNDVTRAVPVSVSPSQGWDGMGRIRVIKRRVDVWYGVRPFKPEVTALQHGDFKDECLHD
jgi:hypothetical protein